jgi:hypothetical protein
VGADCIRDVVLLQVPKESPLQRAPTDRLRFFSLWERIASAMLFSCRCQRNRPYKGLPQIEYGFFLRGSGLYPRCCFACRCQRNRPYKGLPQIEYVFSLWERIASAMLFPCSCQRNRPYKGLPQIGYGFFLCGSGLYPRCFSPADAKGIALTKGSHR